MFADSMLDVSWAQRSRRSLSTLTSFGLQAIVLGVVILFSLLQTVVLPRVQNVSTPIFSGRIRTRPPSLHPITGHPATMPTYHGMIYLRQNESHSVTGAQQQDDDAATDAPYIGEYTDGIDGQPHGPALPISGNRRLPVLHPVAPPPTHTFRTSSMLEGMLIRKVQPIYPPLARAARIQGPVVLAAVISKAGTIDNLHALSGHPMLIPAAIEAVSQWRYRPYILNGEPVEVETQITVNFNLSGN